MKPLIEYLNESIDSNYDAFMQHINDVKAKNGKGIIIQIINNEHSVDFSDKIGYHSAVVIPFNNKRNGYSLMRFKYGNNSDIYSKGYTGNINDFIKSLQGKLVEEFEFDAEAPTYSTAVGFSHKHKYTVKVYQFDVEKASHLTNRQLKCIEPLYYKTCRSALFGVTAFDRKCIWDIVKKYV